MGFTKFLRVLLAVVLFLPFCPAGYNEISRYRPLKEDERDFIDPNDEAYMKRHNITPLIASGYRPSDLSLDQYVVSIRTRQPTAYFGDNHFCTGTLITASMVLTAAHCVVDGQSIITRPKRLHVVAGSPYRLKKEQSTMEFGVSRVLPHWKFKRSVGYDIAILILQDPIPKGHANIKIVSLARIAPEVGTECYTLGWGQLFWDGPYADRLTYGKLTIAPKSHCIASYTSRSHGDLLCAENPTNPYVDTCRGDSGAPLMCNQKLVGVVAFSSMCTEVLKPSTFTDVSIYVDWMFMISRGKPCKTLKMHLFLIFVLSWIVK